MKQQPLISDSERAAIEAAVADAERRTAAEYVLVVARASGRYSNARWYFGLVFGVLAALLTGMWYRAPAQSGSWGDELHSSLSLPVMLLIVIVFVLVGRWLADIVPIFARPFVLRSEQLTAVRRKGTDCFVNLRVSATNARAGVLIYLSLAERMVWVMGDDAVNATMTDRQWGAVRDAVVVALKAGGSKHVANGLIAGVNAASSAIAPSFPGTGASAGELSDRVFVVA